MRKFRNIKQNKTASVVVKCKVGGDEELNLHRLKIYRELNGWDNALTLASKKVYFPLHLHRGYSDVSSSGLCPKPSCPWLQLAQYRTFFIEDPNASDVFGNAKVREQIT